MNKKPAHNDTVEGKRKIRMIVYSKKGIGIAYRLVKSQNVDGKEKSSGADSLLVPLTDALPTRRALLQANRRSL
ncbi:MAG: hypothetical protein R6W72_01245 [Desulfurivibrionaceae bacterium]